MKNFLCKYMHFFYNWNEIITFYDPAFFFWNRVKASVREGKQTLWQFIIHSWKKKKDERTKHKRDIPFKLKIRISTANKIQNFSCHSQWTFWWIGSWYLQNLLKYNQYCVCLYVDKMMYTLKVKGDVNCYGVLVKIA